MELTLSGSATQSLLYHGNIVRDEAFRKLAHNVNDSDKYIHALFCSFVALFTLRVGIHVPEAKISTQWHGSFMLLMAM
jgi:hypothetical protein